jgi:preprotein translocase subunit SecG
MIVVILLQRSEGGGLGLGTGGGVGGLMSGRGTANVLTRTTVVLATIFITTSLGLALLAKNSGTANPWGAVTSEDKPLGTLPDVPAGAPSAPSLPSPVPTPSGASAPALPAVPATAPAAPAQDAPQPANPQPAQPVPAAPAGGGTN